MQVAMQSCSICIGKKIIRAMEGSPVARSMCDTTVWCLPQSNNDDLAFFKIWAELYSAVKL